MSLDVRALTDKKKNNNFKSMLCFSHHTRTKRRKKGKRRRINPLFSFSLLGGNLSNFFYHFIHLEAIDLKGSQEIKACDFLVILMLKAHQKIQLERMKIQHLPFSFIFFQIKWRWFFFQTEVFKMDRDEPVSKTSKQLTTPKTKFVCFLKVLCYFFIWVCIYRWISRNIGLKQNL